MCLHVSIKIAHKRRVYCLMPTIKKLYVLVAAGLLASAGCGGNTTNCKVVGLNVTPAAMTLDHAAASPGNSQIFSASNLFQGSGVCTANTSALINSSWMVSDPSVRLSAMPTAQISVTCTAAVINPVTVAATSADGKHLTGNATLVCK